MKELAQRKSGRRLIDTGVDSNCTWSPTGGHPLLYTTGERLPRVTNGILPANKDCYPCYSGLLVWHEREYVWLFSSTALSIPLVSL